MDRLQLCYCYCYIHLQGNGRSRNIISAHPLYDHFHQHLSESAMQMYGDIGNLKNGVSIQISEAENGSQ